MGKTAILFPGQGAQHVGMGLDVAQAFPAAAAVYGQANELLGIDLARLCFEGPAERLDATDLSQPAIFVTSVAIWRALEANGAVERLAPAGTAGLSLGEYTALWLAGSVSFADGLRLVRRRGELMQAAAQAQSGGMVSVMGLAEQQLRQLCQQVGQMVLANFNCPGQIVVSGPLEACGRLAELVEQAGGAALRLAVAGAFHSPLMHPAAEGLRAVLTETAFHAPKIPVPANVDGQYHDGPEAVRHALQAQVVRPVLWQRCVERLMADGFDRFVEVGPGRVLTGLMRRINRTATVLNISTAEAVRKAAT